MSRITRLRSAAAATVAVLIADIVVVASGILGGSGPAPVAAEPAPGRPAAAVPAPPASPCLGVPASTLLAAPLGKIPSYSRPNGMQVGTVSTWYSYNLVLPVVARQGQWLEVRLPQRPNQSTAWVKATDVKFGETPYYMVVSLSTTHMTVCKDAKAIMTFPVGVGTPATPTVTGNYFVAVHEPKGNALYGPVILDLSAHSDVIKSFEGSGDAIEAIHGPIDATANAQIGTTGAHVSNGCIRLHTTDVEKLADIPVGTPVHILP